MRVACVGMCSGDEIAGNVADASRLIREAHGLGAELIATPEMTTLMDQRSGALARKAKTEDEDEGLQAFRLLAAELGIWLIAGSLPIRISETRYANRCYLIDPEGNTSAVYDKIHMFDVELSDGQVYRESAKFQPGEHAVVARTGLGHLGLTICYDLRFSYLYRALAQAGAEVLFVPAAFTRVTGEAHWHVLLRARAIETGSFVVAPAQGGRHADGRETYGHSLIIGPWGDIMAEGGVGPGVIVADLDRAAVKDARYRIPALRHDRPFLPPV